MTRLAKTGASKSTPRVKKDHATNVQIYAYTVPDGRFHKGNGERTRKKLGCRSTLGSTWGSKSGQLPLTRSIYWVDGVK